MRRVHRFPAALALLGAILAALPASADALGAGEAEAEQQAARMVRYVTLESGLGVRWEPSASILQRLRAALPRPWEELQPLSAPFARSDKPIVTAEALAWTVLAELSYARRLDAQGSPEALVYLYLASRQVGFAQSGLLDASTGLYRPEWIAGSPAGTPKLEDQFRMLWALSAYSTAGGLLPSDVAGSEHLFREQTGTLADRLFRAVEPLLRETLRPGGEAPSSLRMRVLMAAALRAYERAGLAYAQEASRLRAALLPNVPEGLAEAVAWAERPFGETLSLRELAERLLLLRAGIELAPPDAPLRRRQVQAWKDLLSRPGAQRLWASIPWPAEVVHDPVTGEWKPRDSALDVEAAMALAYGLLSATPQTPTPESPSPGAPAPKAGKALERIASLLEEMGRRLEGLEAKAEEARARVRVRAPSGSGPSSNASEPGAQHRATTGRLRGEGAWSPWDALLVGGALMLGLSTVWLAWWGRQRG